MSAVESSDQLREAQAAPKMVRGIQVRDAATGRPLALHDRLAGNMVVTAAC